MKKAIYFLVVAVLAAGLVLSCAPKPAPAPTPAPSPAPAPAPKPVEPIALKMIVSLSTKNPLIVNLQKVFVDKVNERAKGELTIKITGGPETIGTPDQGTAIQRGIVEMGTVYSLSFESIAPGTGAIDLSGISFQLERERGLYELENELLKSVNLLALGRGITHWEPFFYIFTNKRAETPYALAGQRIGSTPAFFPFTKAIGCVPTPIATEDYYIAMEQGLVDGLATVISTWVSLSIHEVTNYIIDHPFKAANSLILINLQTWNRLPKHLQDLMVDCAIESDIAMADFEKGLRAKARQTGLDAGVKIIQFSSADAKWFNETGYRASWEDRMKIYPAVTPKFRDLLSP